ncbi:hypothetical protein ACO2KT_16570, partial [Leptospira interrogans]
YCLFPKLRRIFSSSFHSQLLPLFLEKKVSTFMLLGKGLKLIRSINQIRWNEKIILVGSGVPR